MKMPWDISTAVYEGKNYPHGYQAFGLFVKPDGTKIYFLANGSNVAHEYAFGTPWDVSTLSDTGKTCYYGGHGGGGREIFFSSDGIKMYITESGPSNFIWQYNLGTPWDISTAVDIGISYSPPQVGGWIYGVAFSNDGTQLYCYDHGYNGTSTVYQYSLSIAWDLASTITYTGNNHWLGGEATGGPHGGEIQGIWFSTDGTKMYAGSNWQDHTIWEYILSTAWNVGTASYSAGKHYDFTGTGANQSAGITLSPDGQFAYFNDAVTHNIYELSMEYAPVIVYPTTCIANYSMEPVFPTVCVSTYSINTPRINTKMKNKEAAMIELHRNPAEDTHVTFNLIKQSVGTDFITGYTFVSDDIKLTKYFGSWTTVDISAQAVELDGSPGTYHLYLTASQLTPDVGYEKYPIVITIKSQAGPKDFDDIAMTIWISETPANADLRKINGINNASAELAIRRFSIHATDENAIEVHSDTADGIAIFAGNQGIHMEAGSKGIEIFAIDKGIDMQIRGSDSVGINIDATDNQGRGICIISDSDMIKMTSQRSGGVKIEAADKGIEIIAAEGIEINTNGPALSFNTIGDTVKLNSADGNAIDINAGLNAAHIIAVGKGIDIACGDIGINIISENSHGTRIAGALRGIEIKGGNDYALLIHTDGNNAVDIQANGITGDAISVYSFSGNALTLIAESIIGDGIDIKAGRTPVDIQLIDSSVDPAQILSRLDLSQAMNILLAMANGRFTIDPITNNVTFYDRDGVTALFTMHITTTERTQL